MILFITICLGVFIIYILLSPDEQKPKKYINDTNEYLGVNDVAPSEQPVFRDD
jgi:hypothetical protein